MTENLDSSIRHSVQQETFADQVTEREAKTSADQAKGSIVDSAGFPHMVIKTPSWQKKAELVGLVLSIIVLPIFIGRVIYTLGVIHYNKSLSDANKNMKAAEEKAKFQGMKNVMENRFVKPIQNAVIGKINDKNKQLKDKGKTEIEITPKLIGNFTKAYLTCDERAKEKCRQELDEQGQGEFAAFIENELQKEIAPAIAPLRELDPNLELFSLLRDERASRVEEETDPSKLGKMNRQFIKHLRNILTGDEYQRIKNDPKHLGVRAIQHFALAMYQGVHALDAYKTLGQELHRKKGPQLSPEAQTLDQGTIINTLQESHKYAAQRMFTDHGLVQKAAYAATHLEQAAGSMASEGGQAREIARVLGGEESAVYDTHGRLANNPSIQGTTTWKQGREGVEVTVDNVYGGSPTIGDDEIYPELLAVLDLIKNNNSLDPRDQDPSIPHRFIYTNLQNINKKHGEGPRSATIMKLARLPEYSGVFQAITLPKDSPFYLGKNGAWEGLNTIEQFGQRMLDHMLDESSYSLTDRTGKNKGQGFYFSGGFPDARRKWEGPLNEIISNATEYFSKIEKQNPNVDRKALYAAYQEYVYSMIQATMEAQVAGEITAQDIHTPEGIKRIERPRIMAIRACKENIDRGGAENVKYIYTRYANTPGSNPQEVLDLMVGAFHGRALSSRDRLILEHRFMPMLHFVSFVDAEEFRKQQAKLFQNLQLQVQDPKYKPALLGAEAHPMLSGASFSEAPISEQATETLSAEDHSQPPEVPPSDYNVTA